MRRLLLTPVFLTGCVVMVAPSSVMVTPTQPDRATVSWVPVQDAAKYYVYRGDGGFQGSVLAPATELRVAHLRPGSQVCFRVVAENATGARSSQSQTACAVQPR